MARFAVVIAFMPDQSRPVQGEGNHRPVSLDPDAQGDGRSLPGSGRRFPYLLAVVGFVGVLHWSGRPWVPAVSVSVIVLVFSVIITAVIEMPWRNSDLWRARDGLDGAVILTRWNDRLKRHELHTWATVRHHRGLGRLVLDAAWVQAPRPLWLNPAPPACRVLPGQGRRP